MTKHPLGRAIRELTGSRVSEKETVREDTEAQYCGVVLAAPAVISAFAC